MTDSFYCCICGQIITYIIFFIIIIIISSSSSSSISISNWPLLIVSDALFFKDNVHYIEKVWKHFHINEVIVNFMRCAVR